MAHWIIEFHGFAGSHYQCSDCGYTFNDIYHDVSDDEFCPACGKLIDSEPECVN